MSFVAWAPPLKNPGYAYDTNPLKSEMTTSQEKAQCVSRCIETKSDVHTQRDYRTAYGRGQPSRPSIRLWSKKFMETGT